MNIRTLLPADYDAVYRLWLSCPGLALNDRDDSREGFARFLARNPDTCFAAEEDGALIGVIMTGCAAISTTPPCGRTVRAAASARPWCMPLWKRCGPWA